MERGLGSRAAGVLVVGVAGGSGSGKTTVSQRILEAVGRQHVAYLQHDSYYRDQGHLPPEARRRLNYDHPDCLDTALLVAHLEQLRRGQAIQVPIYDFATHTRRAETRTVQPAPVVLVEGLFILAEPAVRECLDIRLYVDTDPDLRFIRRLERDVSERGRTPEEVIAQYLASVRPMHYQFVEPSKRYADLIIPEGGFNQVATELVVSRIRAALAP